MAENSQKPAIPNGAIATKRGIPIYERNPSIPDPRAISRPRKIDLGQKSVMIRDDGTGEIKAGGVAFWEQEEIDGTRFVKLFLEGVKGVAGTSKAGLQVFEVVYRAVQDTHGTDKIVLSYHGARQYFRETYDQELNERTYHRGLRELLDREVLYRSPADGVFFLNIQFLFNGNRMHFVKTYHLKGTALQGVLPLEDGRPDPAP